ncbi:alginate export family protein [uncultured Roseobacter sp.]|uniref:alginate export family protein n=1 Tax=uncultured Roseobacter sp. TaxID=114847 RepID=UPI002630FD1A|nr:alginate export family protein [uncultured Roseobacter sp.]
MLTSKRIAQSCAVAITCSLFPIAVPTAALAGSKDMPNPPVIFDIAKRKKTKRPITDWLRFSVYSHLRFLGESQIERDDETPDRKDEFAAYLGFVGRADLGRGVTGFVNAEVNVREKQTHQRSYDRIMRPSVKEALLSFPTSAIGQLSIGRLRLSDPHKWVADASVNGLHYVSKSGDKAFEFAAVQGTRNVTATYVLLHRSQAFSARRQGAFAVVEHDAEECRLHLSAYLGDQTSSRFSYQLNAATVVGNAADGRSIGVGIDARFIQKITADRWNPQITYGFAIGTPGFQQSGLHSNKTKDGGQTQFHRYGYVFQPELTNLAVATLAYGLRPSRKLSVDLSAHVYLQPSLTTSGPDARLKGATTGAAHFVGSEISVAGAWRPSKKTKLEIGAGRFLPGPAYADPSSASRVYMRLSVYF